MIQARRFLGIMEKLTCPAKTTSATRFPQKGRAREEAKKFETRAMLRFYHRYSEWEGRAGAAAEKYPARDLLVAAPCSSLRLNEFEERGIVWGCLLKQKQ